MKTDHRTGSRPDLNLWAKMLHRCRAAGGRQQIHNSESVELQRKKKCLHFLMSVCNVVWCVIMECGGTLWGQKRKHYIKKPLTIELLGKSTTWKLPFRVQERPQLWHTLCRKINLKTVFCSFQTPFLQVLAFDNDLQLTSVFPWKLTRHMGLPKFGSYSGLETGMRDTEFDEFPV